MISTLPMTEDHVIFLTAADFHDLICDEVWDWAEEHGIKYSILNPGPYRVLFPDEASAVAFKLRWL